MLRYPPFKSCPCGSGRSFASCCGPRLDGTHPAETPEALMRSRYTAFVLKDAPYLLATWHPDTRPATLDLDGPRWLSLTVHRAAGDQVSFSARYQEDGQKQTLREDSRFVQLERRWLYLDGEHR
ncbi:YchJ family protein [Deinococcus sp. Marseille-Q6407]|uniref:YchJ family protein n=1 Tax=Deinococcus sp. Marseille-Q6407 TaxID=2969223 RepID=UPI0021BE2D2E|nr:YchJ family metal-binding protein [Deinococcus sp. Marseille-Q6407]